LSIALSLQEKDEEHDFDTDESLEVISQGLFNKNLKIENFILDVNSLEV